MSLSKISLSIIFGSLMIGTLPAFAGTTLENSQITVINGSGNYSNNTSNQTVTNSSDGKDKPNIHLQNQQVCDIAGNNNTCINRSEQRVENRRYRRQ